VRSKSTAIPLHMAQYSQIYLPASSGIHKAKFEITKSTGALESLDRVRNQ
jgi:hypothetical protein